MIGWKGTQEKQQKQEEVTQPPPLPSTCSGRRSVSPAAECRIILTHYHCYHCDEVIIPSEGVSKAVAGTVGFEVRVRWASNKEYDKTGIAICTSCVVSALVKGR